MNKQTRKELMRIHSSLIYFLLEYKFQEFDIKNKKIKNDIEFLIALRKYIGLNKKKEAFKKMFFLIQQNLEVI